MGRAAGNPRLEKRWDRQLSPDTGCVSLTGGWSRVWAWVFGSSDLLLDPSVRLASGEGAPPL